MRSGGLFIAFPAYFSFMVLMSIITFAVPMAILPFLLPLIFRVSLLSLENLLLTTMISFASSVLTFTIMYIYPGIKSNNRKNPIEANLPYVSSFLTLLSSSNVPPRKIFGSITTISTLKMVRQDFSNILRDVEVFGRDLLTSIIDNIKYVPNRRLQEVLSGYVAMIRTGGNPTEYLRIQTDNIIEGRMVRLNLMLERLAALAEIYIMVLVAMPLLFIVLFATLGMLGGTSTMDPGFMLNLLAYGMIPIMAAAIIVIVDGYTTW